MPLYSYLFGNLLFWGLGVRETNPEKTWWYSRMCNYVHVELGILELRSVFSSGLLLNHIYLRTYFVVTAVIYFGL